jgi:HEPN domain-containing protein
MKNSSIAMEWLELARRNLVAAKILFEAKHFNDVIGIKLHQCIEKSLKALPAFHKKTVLKTHDLMALLSLAEKFLQFDPEIRIILETATDYYVENRYPGGVLTFFHLTRKLKK